MGESMFSLLTTLWLGSCWSLGWPSQVVTTHWRRPGTFGRYGLQITYLANDGMVSVRTETGVYKRAVAKSFLLTLAVAIKDQLGLVHLFQFVIVCWTMVFPLATLFLITSWLRSFTNKRHTNIFPKIHYTMNNTTWSDSFSSADFHY